jgi:hypothetical protein
LAIQCVFPKRLSESRRRLLPRWIHAPTPPRGVTVERGRIEVRFGGAHEAVGVFVFPSGSV